MGEKISKWVKHTQQAPVFAPRILQPRLTVATLATSTTAGRRLSTTQNTGFRFSFPLKTPVRVLMPLLWLTPAANRTISVFSSQFQRPKARRVCCELQIQIDDPNHQS